MVLQCALEFSLVQADCSWWEEVGLQGANSMARILNDEAAYSMVKWLNGGNTQAIKRRQLNAENADRS